MLPEQEPVTTWHGAGIIAASSSAVPALRAPSPALLLLLPPPPPPLSRLPTVDVPAEQQQQQQFGMSVMLNLFRTCGLITRSFGKRKPVQLGGHRTDT
ncbi:unnamed protein product [Lampetra planeri]